MSDLADKCVKYAKNVRCFKRIVRANIYNQIDGATAAE